ncbi:type II toxin-antitoxin system RelE/ParE family toxin [Halomonas sp.]|uniref:type II toxin-antitoxin system RelE/ParE family toxin n=1 Tax=Halomonas sp. TaxID=1486246 RepID=UPI00356794DF
MDHTVEAVRTLRYHRQPGRIGRPTDDLPEEYRDWLIDYGDSGYIARYRIDGDTVVVLAIRHQKEASF